ncbi:hypothetical protein LNTAR_23464 [Lentisphaera araneosa HTCC2155]|uniref:Uncharacterized protein n=1 Tax=Lentisphaera araneosa HTCC2155 TaxID=313628 RepID=A6DGT4_9BACT|nr:hypothetical protein LNTAR_23464 [Lentisphaera araneosa HTCC2155]
MFRNGEIPKGYLLPKLIVANIIFFIGGFVFYFGWQYWIKTTLKKNGLDGLLNR